MNYRRGSTTWSCRSS